MALELNTDTSYHIKVYTTLASVLHPAMHNYTLLDTYVGSSHDAFVSTWPALLVGWMLFFALVYWAVRWAQPAKV
jgi:hypothetical protein